MTANNASDNYIQTPIKPESIVDFSNISNPQLKADVIEAFNVIADTDVGQELLFKTLQVMAVLQLN